MAYTALAQQAVAGPYLSEAGADQLTAVTFTDGDATNGNKVVMSSGRTLLVVQNTDAAQQTVTIESSADPYGRTATISAFAVPAGEFAARIFEPVGWEATLGGRDLVVTVSATTVKLLAIPL